MTLSDISVRRPVLATVANLLLIVFGLSALGGIAIRELPDVDNAVVTVTTSYLGATSEVIDTDITETVEGAVASISGIRSISSESRQGQSRVTIEFEAGRDVDVAANDVRDAVGRIRRRPARRGRRARGREKRCRRRSGDAPRRGLGPHDHRRDHRLSRPVHRRPPRHARRGGEPADLWRTLLCGAHLARPPRHGRAQAHRGRCPKRPAPQPMSNCPPAK